MAGRRGIRCRTSIDSVYGHSPFTACPILSHRRGMGRLRRAAQAPTCCQGGATARRSGCASTRGPPAFAARLAGVAPCTPCASGATRDACGGISWAAPDTRTWPDAAPHGGSSPRSAGPPSRLRASRNRPCDTRPLVLGGSCCARQGRACGRTARSCAACARSHARLLGSARAAPCAQAAQGFAAAGGI